MAKKADRQAEVIDSSDLRKYRIEIPNLIDDMKLSVYAFRLYVHLKRVAGAGNGACFQSTRTLAKACRMSMGKVSESKKELEAAKLIRIETREEWSTDHIRIVDIWRKNFEHYATDDPTPPEEDTPAVPPDPPVHDMNTRSPGEQAFTTRTPCSPHEHPVHQVNAACSPHETKKEPIKKEPNKKEPGEEERAAPTAPAPSEHPAVAIFYEIMGKFPSKAQMQEIIDHVVDRELWRAAVKAWNLAGNKPTNVKGMLDWYDHPERFEEPYRPPPNGGDYAPQRSGTRTVPQSKVAASMSAIDQYEAIKKANQR
jgi:hypothetical protein